MLFNIIWTGEAFLTNETFVAFFCRVARNMILEIGLCLEFLVTKRALKSDRITDMFQIIVVFHTCWRTKCFGTP